MTPDDNDKDIDYEENGGTAPIPSRTDRVVPSLQRGSAARDVEMAQRTAAANVTRSQIDRIYQTDDPYARTHSPDPVAAAADTTPEDHFKQYHTAWQDYYQKYYESYYTQAVRQTQEQLRQRADLEAKSAPGALYGQNAITAESTTADDTPHTAARKLQAQFKKKVGERAGKVRKSRHFWPLVTAFTVAGVFIFLQYNRLLIANVAAYVSPGSVDPQNIIVDPTSDTKVSDDPRIIIPKINVDAPVIYTVTEYDNDKIEAALKDGTVKYAIPGANAFPGQVGNLVIGGHSSNDVFDNGGYKFVFVQLEKIVVGDTFYLNYQGTRYTYHVTKTQTVDPSDTAGLVAPVTKPTVTLITCTPVGTALHRFLVYGEQVSPDPSGATVANNTSTATSNTIPGNSPTLLQRIFGQ